MGLALRDHIDGFTISSADFEKFPNTQNALRTLLTGIHSLYEATKNAESEVKTEEGIAMVVVGNLAGLPEFEGLPLQLIECYFHWYAVSACNYLTLVGWIRQQVEPTAPTAAEYVKSVLPEVLAFRHKVAAHFAQSYPPSKKDNPAEQMLSTFPQLGFQDDRFVSAPLTLHIRQSGVAHDTSALKPWSLTRVHEALADRFNPDGPEPPIVSVLAHD